MSSRIQLAEMIQSLREELQSAISDDGEEAVPCVVNEVELELDVAIQREDGDSGPVRFYVIEANAGDDDDRETHTLRIQLGCLTAEEEGDEDA